MRHEPRPFSFRLIWAQLCACLGLALPAPLAHAAAPHGPVVLELFTSQGCSSCPPADRLLAELAQNPAVLALDSHVDYWDGRAWRDRFSLAAATARQRWYAGLGNGEVYTPQLVINGRTALVGSRRAEVLDAIASETARAAAAPPGPALVLARDGDGLGLTLTGAAPVAGSSLLLIGYDARHETQIGGGENGGARLVEVNVVRSIAAAGAPRSQRLAWPAGEHAAILLQAADGAILAAAAI